MNRSFLSACRNKEELAAAQLAGLQWTVRHAWNGSPFYRKRLTEAGVTPDRIRSLVDLKRLPFVTAQDLQANYPWPLLLIAAPAAVAIWSGWVGLGSMCGFGPVNLLPGVGGRVIELRSELEILFAQFGEFAQV